MNDFLSTISYVSPDGVNVINFNDGNGFFIEEGGAQGLSGDTEDIAIELPRGGQHFVGFDVKSMHCELKVVAFGDDYEEQAQGRMVFLTSLFSRRKEGTLILDNHDGEVFTLPVRLEKQIEVPDQETTFDDTIQRSFPIVCDRGYWTHTVHPLERKSGNQYSYEINNNGDLPTNALVHWNHTIGTLPPKINIDESGDIQLPSPAGEEEGRYTLDLDPRASMAVLDEDGSLDLDMWKQLRGRFLSAEVLPGETQVITSNKPLDLTYDLKILNPWRW